MTEFSERPARVDDNGEARSVRFRTRSHGRRAGDGGESGHGGREVIRHHDGEADRHVYVHRLAAFAWEPDLRLSDLWARPEDERSDDPRTDKMEVHHDTPIPWLNTEENLEWADDREHGEIEAERRKRGPDGSFVRG